jgi:hypothetical protein
MKIRIPGIPSELLKQQPSPCISIYMPTGKRHPENLGDALHFKNLLTETRNQGLQLAGKREIQPLLDRLSAMVDDHDFWMHSLEGIAAFVAPGIFMMLRLQEPVAEEVSVSLDGKFHLRPLLRIFQATDRFQLLALTRTDLRLYEGNRLRLVEIPRAPGVPKDMEDALGHQTTPPHQTMAFFGGAENAGSMRHGHSSRKDEEELDNERFFRAVDRAVDDCHSSVSGLPLILAALPEHQSLFRKVSHNPLLVADAVDVDPRMVSTEELRRMAWDALEPRWKAQVEAAIARYEEYRSKSLGDDDPFVVAKAASTGKVRTLLLDRDRRYAGKLDWSTGRITPVKSEARADDALEAIAMLVLENGGEVLVLPSERMPSQTGVAAIYRYS